MSKAIQAVLVNAAVSAAHDRAVSQAGGIVQGTFRGISGYRYPRRSGRKPAQLAREYGFTDIDGSQPDSWAED
jgi:hypothetical protein